MNYFVFGTNNMPLAMAFYDAIFAGTQIRKLNDEGRMTLWAGDNFMFALAEPFDEKEVTVGNGTMVGFNLKPSAEVERIYETALSVGGIDAGKSAIRSGRFSAHVRGLDGNKICLFE